MTEAQLTLSALDALYGLATNTLVRVTLEYNINTLHVQIILLKSSSEADVESLRCFSSELLAKFYDAKLDEEIIFVHNPAEARGISDRRIKVFAVAGAEHISNDN